jgi:hypothetical protein
VKLLSVSARLHGAASQRIEIVGHYVLIVPPSLSIQRTLDVSSVHCFRFLSGFDDLCLVSHVYLLVLILDVGGFLVRDPPALAVK